MKKNIIFLSVLFIVFFGTNARCNPEITYFQTNADTIGLYEKYEIRFDITAEFVNPFDPDEIDITAIFTAPSGKSWTIPGFYNYSSSRTLWMIRFSPNEPGQWHYVINIKDMSGNLTSESKTFAAVKSQFHGPVHVAGNNRYLEHDDGTPFFGVGLWYNDSYNAFDEGRIEPEVLDHLKELGVNFISTFITPLETWGSGLGRYDQNICGRLDEVLNMCEERNMILSLNLWFHSYLSKTVWGGGNVRWNTNPYQLVCDAKDFYSSDEAWSYQENLYRYFIARYGYSRSLGIWFIVDEVNGTDGWVSGDSTGAANWARKIQNYFDRHDPYNHPTTGTRSGGIREWWQQGYEILDMAGREIYEAQGFPILQNGTVKDTDTHPLTYSYRNYAGQIQKLWQGFNKPVIVPETGWDHVFYEPSMPEYLAQYHDALWVTMANGSAMSPFWWSYSTYLNDNILTRQITNFRKFVDQIPWSKLTSLNPVEIRNSDGDAYAMGSDQLVYGWAANAGSDMAGNTITLSSIKNGTYKVRIYHTWRGRFIQESEMKTQENLLTFTMPSMQIEGSHARYIGKDVAFILEPVE